jgi:REP element-mobilizing transposase RayT
VTLFRNQYRVETARFADWDYRSGGWYFITLCTKDKKCSLGSMVGGKIVLSPAGTIAEREIPFIAKHHSNSWIDTSVVMPNHVHAIFVIDGLHQYSPDSKFVGHHPGASLATIVGGYKSAVSRMCRLEGIPDFQWQPRFHDRILGSNAAVEAVREYIRQNPEDWQDDPDRPKSIKMTRSSPAVP